MRDGLDERANEIARKAQAKQDAIRDPFTWWHVTREDMNMVWRVLTDFTQAEAQHTFAGCTIRPMTQQEVDDWKAAK